MFNAEQVNELTKKAIENKRLEEFKDFKIKLAELNQNIMDSILEHAKNGNYSCKFYLNRVFGKKEEQISLIKEKIIKRLEDAGFNCNISSYLDTFEISVRWRD